MSVTVAPTRRKSASEKEGPRPRPWTREEFYRAAERGIFRPDEKLELLDGEIISRMTQNPPHAALLSRTARLVTNLFGPDYSARQEKPLVLNGSSEPLPDLVIVPGTELDYLAKHPTAADARLVIEVSDTTLYFDRNRKRTAYARAGIAEYWIVNLPEWQLEVFRDPSRGRYRTSQVLRGEESVSPLAAPHATLRVDDLLPPTAPSAPTPPSP